LKYNILFSDNSTYHYYPKSIVAEQMDRVALLNELGNKSGNGWDIIVIGGGATGLGIALDASSRGYKTLLLEQSDFAKATSSRSTKLIHGGVRYLAQGDLLLVMEALRERGLLLKNAPDLITDQEFIIPVYRLWDALQYTVGLKFYDLLAGRLSMGKSYFISREETLKRLPQIKPEGIKGGVVYHDGQFDDARMAITLAKACVDSGGVVLNYIMVTGLLKNENGDISGVVARDLNTDSELNLYASLVINATGVFADQVIRLDTPDSKTYIRPSQGVHIVLDKSFLGSESAIMIPKTEDGRVLFAIPWYDKVVVGTTDTPLDNIDLEPVALESEIDFILHTAGKYLEKPPGREDIHCIFAGLRPLASTPENPTATKEISRRHKIILSQSQLLTITGGKWTTYRLMAEETLKIAINAGLLKKRKCVTSDLKLNNLSIDSSSSRLHIYGDKFTEIEQIIMEKPELGDAIDPRLPYTRAEIIWICRNEMPLKLEDMLARRTRALFLDVRVSISIAAVVAEIMAVELGFEQNWQEEQINAYKQLVTSYL
jgi:glycerol-3-phosphate dehydrogenase